MAILLIFWGDMFAVFIVQRGLTGKTLGTICAARSSLTSKNSCAGSASLTLDVNGPTRWSSGMPSTEAFTLKAALIVA